MKREKYLAKFHRKWEKVIQLREEYDPPTTWQEIGDKFGVSAQRAMQMYQQGKARKNEA